MRHQLDGTSWVNREVHAQICGGRRGKFPPPTRHLSQGFDFLGFNIRRYQTWRGGKLLTKPSKDAVRKIKRRLTAEIRALRGANSAVIIGRLNPVIRGWAAYCVSRGHARSVWRVVGSMS